MKKLFAAWMAGLWMIAMTGAANASVTTFTDRSLFNNQGLIAYNSNFEDYGTMPQNTPGQGFLGTPFTRGDVTYYSNLTWMQVAEFKPGYPNYIIDYDGTPLLGNIKQGPKYNMFGFDITQYGDTPVSIALYTNTGQYSYSGLTIVKAEDGLSDFKGYIASPGEYFTNFRIEADKGLYGHAAGITNVAVGNSPSPEPATLVLMCIGGLFVAFRLKKSGIASAFSV